MLKGIDVSGWQENSIVSQMSPQFIMIKASEGVNYKSDGLDRLYNTYIAWCKTKNITPLYGFYHYARPETGNSAAAEVDSFLSYVGHHIGKSRFALDWEGDALKVGEKWAYDFLDILRRKTNARPLLYVSASVARNFSLDFKSICDLWVAHWGVSKPDFGNKWPTWALWQYSDKPCDLDYFNGEASNWLGKSSAPVKVDWKITSQSDTKIVLEKK